MRNLLTSTKAFADPTRIRLIAALRAGELCVCELCDALDVVQSTLSTHLQFLRQADLVQTRQEGKWVYYRLSAGFARMADALFSLHRAELKTDPLLARDAARLKKRLGLRDADACCRGFTPKKPAARRKLAAAAR